MSRLIILAAILASASACVVTWNGTRYDCQPERVSETVWTMTVHCVPVGR